MELYLLTSVSGGLGPRGDGVRAEDHGRSGLRAEMRWFGWPRRRKAARRAARLVRHTHTTVEHARTCALCVMCEGAGPGTWEGGEGESGKFCIIDEYRKHAS